VWQRRNANVAHYAQTDFFGVLQVSRAQRLTGVGPKYGICLRGVITQCWSHKRFVAAITDRWESAQRFQNLSRKLNDSCGYGGRSQFRSRRADA
jgi:hypothetical protein